MPMISPEVKIDPERDGVVMLSPEVVYFNDAQPRPDGRKIYHIFEHALDGEKENGHPMQKCIRDFELSRNELFSKASENTIQYIQEVLETNGIPFDEWCPPVKRRSSQPDWTSSQVFINVGIIEERNPSFIKSEVKEEEENCPAEEEKSAVVDERIEVKEEEEEENEGREEVEKGEEEEEKPKVKRETDESMKLLDVPRYRKSKAVKTYPESDWHRCPLCSFVSLYKRNFGVHMVKFHAGQKHGTEEERRRNPLSKVKTEETSRDSDLFRGGVRGFSSIREGEYKRHLRTTHPSELRSRKVKREKTYPDSDIFRCQACPFSSLHKYNYSRHMKTRHPELEMDIDVISGRAEKEGISSAISIKKELDGSKGRVKNELVSSKSDVRVKLKCLKCNFSTYKNLLFKNHLLRHSDKRKFECSECAFSTHFKKTLEIHSKKHLDKINGSKSRYTCSTCPFTSTHKNLMKRHESKHVSRKCPKCPFEAKSQSRLKEHVSTHSDRDQLLKSKQESYSSQTHLQESSEVRGELLSCSKCPFTTYSDSHLRNHDKEVHKGLGKNLKCDQCSFATSFEVDFKQHVHLHATCIYKCYKCKLPFRTRVKLKEHIKTHSKIRKPKRFNKGFKSKKWTLSLVSKVRRSFQCKICEYSCQSQHLMDQHDLSHLQKKKLKCYHCDYETNFRGNLVRHVLIHVDDYIIN